jgi:hypothetical protein
MGCGCPFHSFTSVVAHLVSLYWCFLVFAVFVSHLLVLSSICSTNKLMTMLPVEDFKSPWPSFSSRAQQSLPFSSFAVCPQLTRLGGRAGDVLAQIPTPANDRLLAMLCVMTSWLAFVPFS